MGREILAGASDLRAAAMEPIYPSPILAKGESSARSGRFRLRGKSPISFRISLGRVLAHYAVDPRNLGPLLVRELSVCHVSEVSTTDIAGAKPPD